MSLKGAKLIWTNKKEKSEKVIHLKNKKNFKFGYYMTNDFILNNPQAKPVHCEIIADAFNRISIINNSRQNPISLNGFRVKTRRPLLHGSKIKIFDDEFVWQFPRNGKVKSRELTTESKNRVEEEKKTPEKNQQENIPAPISEPWKKKHKLRIKERLSAHR
ncbi:uncharacterized protein LOC129608081 [Condylostylus longicornis]|uniref:uncharacterized protein LOC129608081 n=1 Tax=Condylostylus longicornis TaxID=2530218 RepID=UPI00244DBC60|nr:uncharacterized protein LOC129608081 [Condylostylus longicornis]